MRREGGGGGEVSGWKGRIKGAWEGGGRDSMQERGGYGSRGRGRRKEVVEERERRRRKREVQGEREEKRGRRRR